ncbi:MULTISPECIES: hypothetical protein [Pyrobaculum]|nr:hypothetical protein [Pyrobaculum arsenaticum]MCY0890419.1 hypothetical protein [Pyrobaculum arsenaticum]
MFRDRPAGTLDVLFDREAEVESLLDAVGKATLTFVIWMGEGWKNVGS